MRQITRAACAAVCGLAALPLLSGQAGAQPSCAPASRVVSPAETGRESKILQRKITLGAGTVALREALGRVAEAGRFRLSYSADLLELERLVCLEYKSAPVIQVLSDILVGASVRAVAVGANQVALTPVNGAQAPARVGDAESGMRNVGQLDSVVVTGNSVGALERSVPAALAVVSGDQISRHGATTVSRMINGAVPGLWVWEQSPVDMLTRYASVRGASSFGVSYPKVYLDGIEAANSLLVTHFDPDAISRIEVIRGPQGAALYGADAISGVLNIVTRQEGTESGAPRAQVRSQGGAAASDYSVPTVLTQNHAATLRYGNTRRSVRLGVRGARIGAFIPDAFSQQLNASGNLRFVNSRGVITGTLRLFAHDARAPGSPLLSSPEVLVPSALADSAGRQSVRQFTVGTTGTFIQNERWTHSAVVGLDGYVLSSSAATPETFPTAIDSALRAATGNALRATFRATSIGRFGNEEGTSTTLTIAAEHSALRDETTMRGPADLSTRDTRSSTGLVGQVSTGFRNTFFLTGGLRLERNTALAGLGDFATLPMLGATAVHSFGATTIKLRSAFGKGIRPVQAASRAGALMGFTGLLFGSPLSPEEQSGTEFGLDATVGGSFGLHVTRFDQRASGLVQPVSVFARVGPRFRHVGYELQNVGEITNRGWELQTSLASGPWSIGAMFSRVDSRVGELGRFYTGDLRPGDRMIEVPAHTFGLNGAFVRGPWFTSFSLARASDWISYDRLALSNFIRATDSPGAPVGEDLRAFWRSYDGVTRVGARVGVNLVRGMTLTLDGENLLDAQRGEPDNLTVLPGRTLTAGLKVSF